MDKCGICFKQAVQLFETSNNGVFACFKCQPLVPEVTLDDASSRDNMSVDVDLQSYEEGNDDSLFCGICNKTFQKNIQLQNHLRNHRAERRFVCTYCNKAFSQSNNLRAHLRIHTNERPYKCSECGKAFTQVTNLNNHVRLHTGERPFVCPEPGCNKAYAQVTNLNQHKKRHLNGRPLEATYDCTVCGEQFDQRNHMYIHRREAHADERGMRGSRGGAGAGKGTGEHACATCPSTFPTHKQLAQHVASHTATIATEEDPLSGAGDGMEGGVEEVGEGEEGLKCVFPSCEVRVASARHHTEHLLRAHQLRVLATPTGRSRPPRRGRPPKAMKVYYQEDNNFIEVPVSQLKEEPVYIPKLKVQNMFQ